MNRYKMLVGSDEEPKDKPGKSSDPPEKVISFGFERNSIETTEKKERRTPYYRPAPGITNRIGILYRDPSNIFVGAQVHFAGRYMLCKSDSHHREACCTEATGRAVPRIACIIAIYPAQPEPITLSANDFELRVWTFGRRILENIMSIGAGRDFIVTGTEQRFNPYEIQMGSTSILQNLNAQEQEALLARHDVIRPTLDSYLGQDLPLDEILRIYRENPQPTQSLRPAEPIRPTPPFHRPVTQRPRPSNEDEDLGSLLDSL